MTLLGIYTTSDFTLSSDGAGGALIVDAAAPADAATLGGDRKKSRR